MKSQVGPTVIFLVRQQGTFEIDRAWVCQSFFIQYVNSLSMLQCPAKYFCYFQLKLYCYISLLSSASGTLCSVC